MNYRGTITGISGVSGAALTVAVPLIFPDQVSAQAHLLAGVGTYVLIIAQARSTLPWCEWFPASKVIRRIIRVAVYFIPVVAVNFPYPAISDPALISAVLIGVAGLAVQRREIRTGLSCRYLRLLPPVGHVDRGRDLFFFGSSGAAQEYLYHGVLLAGLAGFPVLAVSLTTALFVAEHLVQLGARKQWDLKDKGIHSALGLALGCTVIVGHSLPAAMIGHTIYNLPNVIQAILRPGVPALEGKHHDRFN